MVSTELQLIAAHLESLEETIIHRLIDRAQFHRNLAAYEPGQSGFSGEELDRSLFDIRLRFQEEMDAVFGRFTVPEERPFHDDLPRPARTITLPANPLQRRAAARVNCTARIVTAYLDFLPFICETGDDGQYGSSVEHDVIAVQAIARRIHYGALYVAESKYLSSPEEFGRSIREAQAGDLQPLTALITREEVEKKILERVAQKVDYIQASLNPVVRRRIDPQAVLSFYRDTIIPLTKEGEISYLLARQSSPA